eukprot:CAMPEP_0174234138 /NCGR_PEP_ID=MMETSP0417-20130205/3979_1 /TAXON_ID=242541 /ORGANISM="Mayorella sp, Strain BSH-02190019" /LENGTH=216 /DNA_ID=CAMNT_0015312455 /DNA_START=114 /DNA_END=764 /DNA_ORIENTATION=+
MDGRTSAKLVLLGSANVGKTSLVLRYVRDVFYERGEATVGAAFTSKSLPLQNGQTLRLEIWDTAGQERYHSLAPLYYRDAKVALVVYDVTNLDSLERAKQWVVELREEPSCADITIALVGNKCDLIEERVISRESVEAYAKSENIFFAETSAKLRENVDTLFAQVAMAVTNSRPLGGGAIGDGPAPAAGAPVNHSIRLEGNHSNGGASSENTGCCG